MSKLHQHQHDFFARAISDSLRSGFQSSEAHQPTKKWECMVCEELHSTEIGAKYCCPNSVRAIFECVSCGDQYTGEDAAAKCCVAPTAPRACPVCQKMHPSFEEAVDCHLFLYPGLQPAIQWRIAQRLTEGATWAEALSEAGIDLSRSHTGGHAA